VSEIHDIGRSVFAGFLSGTSIGVLPVAAVEDVENGFCK
jgi:hypothetical protein